MTLKKYDGMEWTSEQEQAVANMQLNFGLTKFGEFLDWLRKC